MRVSTSVDVAAIVASLPTLPLNYRPDEIDSTWRRDVHEHHIGKDPNGPPRPGDTWHRARDLVHGYQFTPPDLLRAFYRPDTDLVGRDMLLQGRFHGLRFLMPVRITHLHDHQDDHRTVFGWAYETLEGHIERGRVDYELAKHHSTGDVTFTARSLWQFNPRAHPVIRLGWTLFGRHAQLRFYRGIGHHLRTLATAPAPIVEVPSRTTSRGLTFLNATR
jgi:uncharacterized protein (UPF0548 family)